MFERIKILFRRLRGVRPTATMTVFIVEIMVEVLSVLRIATMEIEQIKPYYSPVSIPGFVPVAERVGSGTMLGGSQIEDALQRLEKLTQEVSQMATAITPHERDEGRG